MRRRRIARHTALALLLTALTLAAYAAAVWRWRAETTQALSAAADPIAAAFAASNLSPAAFAQQRAPLLSATPFLTQLIAADGAVVFSPASQGGPPLPVTPTDLIGTLNGQSGTQTIGLTSGPALLLLRPLRAAGLPVAALALAAPIPWLPYPELVIPLLAITGLVWLHWLWRRWRAASSPGGKS